ARSFSRPIYPLADVASSYDPRQRSAKLRLLSDDGSGLTTVEGPRAGNAMSFRLLITGGAGFVGSSLALAFTRRHADWAVVATNLGGTVNCLEHLRRHGGDLIFLSTSRVYPIAGLRDLPLERRGDRLDLAAGAAGPGWSAAGVAETFPLTGPRSLYGATKL